MVRRASAISLLAAAVLLAACGGGENDDGPSEEEQVREAASGFAEAFANKDGAAACPLITLELAEELLQGDVSCPELFSLDIPTEAFEGAVIDEVTIEETTAAVTFVNTDTGLTLEKVDSVGGDE